VRGRRCAVSYEPTEQERKRAYRVSELDGMGHEDLVKEWQEVYAGLILEPLRATVKRWSRNEIISSIVEAEGRRLSAEEDE
jgi:hypothetical protein